VYRGRPAGNREVYRGRGAGYRVGSGDEAQGTGWVYPAGGRDHHLAYDPSLLPHPGTTSASRMLLVEYTLLDTLLPDDGLPGL